MEQVPEEVSRGSEIDLSEGSPASVPPPQEAPSVDALSPTPLDGPPPVAPPSGSRLLGRRDGPPSGLDPVLAVVQVVLVSGIPTQVVVAIGFILATYGWPHAADLEDLSGRLRTLEFIAITSLVDTALVALMLRFFLSFSRETSSEVFVGPRRPWSEIAKGLALAPVAIIAVQLVAFGLRTAFPALHTVEENPYAEYMTSPIEASIFVVVVILAGGVREELQRAFIIRRFDQYLGGARIGLVLFSLLFGALHYPQGADAAIVIGLLGLVFGILYIRRQSAVLSIAAHAGFDVGMVVLQYFGRALGI